MIADPTGDSDANGSNLCIPWVEYSAKYVAKKSSLKPKQDKISNVTTRNFHLASYQPKPQLILRCVLLLYHMMTEVPGSPLPPVPGDTSEDPFGDDVDSI